MKIIDLLEPIIYQRGLEKGKQEGRREGKQQGLKEGQIELAKNLLARGIDIDVLIASGPFSKEELLALLNAK